MATAIPSVENLCNRLTRSRLLKSGQVRAAYSEWRRLVPTKHDGEVGRFAKWLVNGHYLTAYQAQQLVLGHSDHFILHHYKLLDLIGKGRMAGIFKAAHVSGHIVAIKVMPHAKSKESKVLARFRREAKMAVRLKHDNIVRTHHLGVVGTRHYIVMEYLEGETLEDVLKRRKRLPFPEAVRLIHQALVALDHIYGQGVIHRDLKPGNLMLTPLRPPGAPDNTEQATLKVLDIGLGRALFDEKMTADQEEYRLTVEGTMLGTLDYMAPEQARDSHNVDIRADIFSLGAVLYHMLGGKAPFEDKNQINQLVRLASQPHQPICELEESVPTKLQKVLDVMLLKDPKQRFATPRKAAEALLPFAVQTHEQLPEARHLGEAYERWVESQPFEEVSGGGPVLADRWLYRHQGKQQGPVSSAQLDQLAASGKLGPDDVLWMEGDDPSMGIHARAALDFSALRGGAPTQHTSGAPTVAESGFDANTGRIIDPEKFRRWQKEQQLKRNQERKDGPTIQEVYEKARGDLSNWVDLDKNRRLILTADMEALRHDDSLRKFMHAHQRFGDEILHKLWHHLEFVVENRRKYYYALAR